MTGRTNALQRLQDWRNEHKSHSVTIETDDGYGASCWMVELRGRGKKVYAAEFPFLKGGTKPEGVVYVNEGEDADWCSLEEVIHAAIDKAEELGL